MGKLRMLVSHGGWGREDEGRNFSSIFFSPPADRKATSQVGVATQSVLGSCVAFPGLVCLNPTPVVSASFVCTHVCDWCDGSSMSLRLLYV